MQPIPPRARAAARRHTRRGPAHARPPPPHPALNPPPTHTRRGARAQGFRHAPHAGARGSRGGRQHAAPCYLRRLHGQVRWAHERVHRCAGRLPPRDPQTPTRQAPGVGRGRRCGRNETSQDHEGAPWWPHAWSRGRQPALLLQLQGLLLDQLAGSRGRAAVRAQPQLLLTSPHHPTPPRLLPSSRRFIYGSVMSPGSEADQKAWACTSLGDWLAANPLPPGYYFLADEVAAPEPLPTPPPLTLTAPAADAHLSRGQAYKADEHCVTPYPGQDLPRDEDNFNHLQCTVRSSSIECAFGRLIGIFGDRTLPAAPPPYPFSTAPSALTPHPHPSRGRHLLAAVAGQHSQVWQGRARGDEDVQRADRLPGRRVRGCRVRRPRGRRAAAPPAAGPRVAQGRWPRAPAERAASSPRPRGARPLRDPGRAQGGGARGLVLPARVVAGLNSVRFGFGG